MFRRLLLAATIALGCLGSGIGRLHAREPVYPGAVWVAETDATAADHARADALRNLLRRGDTTGMMVVVGGRMRFAYGDVAEVSYIASARKSVVAMLYGRYVENGTIRLSATLRDLGIDDRGGLLPVEREASVADLLAARSGVYHGAANQGDASARAPARGSVRPGAYFLYNNWDFNALETILERATGRSIYDLFSDDLAAPLQLEDWDRRPRAYANAIRNDTGASDFPAHHLVLSTRDMARLGYLMLRRGQWNERQVIPAAWVGRITSVVTPADEVARTSPFIPGLAYGNLWWILSGSPFRGGPLDGAFTASGAYGQFITVIPRLDAVVAHKTLAPSTRNVPAETYFSRILPGAIGLVAR
ncbi:MAG TPA: serine hydrolase [Vicinamibacterales bacterium]|jgi:CubicO group peptidase (beta-lactamase class C family)|nr:serine hydrolase [Vicinamibacterales bacterium]